MMISTISALITCLAFLLLFQASGVRCGVTCAGNTKQYYVWNAQ